MSIFCNKLWFSYRVKWATDKNKFRNKIENKQNKSKLMEYRSLIKTPIVLVTKGV